MLTEKEEEKKCILKFLLYFSVLQRTSHQPILVALLGFEVCIIQNR